MKRFIVSILMTVLSCNVELLFAQATVLGSDGVDGTYYTYDLTDQGILRQAQFQANVSASSGARKWEFCEGTSVSPLYSTNWRPYSGPLTIAGYDQTIPPVGGTASAVYNTGFGGTSGNLPAITAGNYYTFNITEYSTPGTPVDEYMGVLETNFAPCDVATVTQTPAAASVMADNSVLVTVDCATAPSAGEYIYLRWSTTFNFLTSTLTQVTMSGTTGTAIIPCQSSGTTIYYYVYSSNRTSAAILADVVSNGQVAHDMSSLVLNNNGGPNYQYTVLPTSSACGSYYVPSTCFPTIASFVTFLNGTSVTCPVTCYVAAGHTETAPTGGINLTQTGTSLNPISIEKYGSGANPVIYAQTGTVTMSGSSTTVDGIFSLNGSDYITINGIDVTDNNASAPETMEYGYALFKASATDGCQYNSIKNCSITLKKSNATSGPGNFGDGCRGIFSGNLTRTALTTTLVITSSAGRSDYNTFTANTIRNVHSGIIIRGYSDASPYTYYDQNNTVGDSGAGNTIENYGSGAALTCYGVYMIHQNNATIAYNSINNAASGGTGHLSTLYGIFHSSTNSGTLGINVTLKNNTISLMQGAVTSRLTGIRTGNSSVGAGSVIISGNTVENCSYMSGASGDFYGIDNEFVATTLSISNNNIQNNTFGTTGTLPLYLIFNNTSSATVTVSDNYLYNNTKATTAGASIYGYYNATGASTIETITNNTLNTLTIPATSNAGVIGIRSSTASGTVLKYINNNSISNITGGSTSSSIYTAGIVADGMATGSQVETNTVNTINANKDVIGIYCGVYNNISTSGTNYAYTVSDNSVSNINNTATLSAYGIVLHASSSGSGTIACNGNTITGITESGAGVGSIAGIKTNYGTAAGVFNIYDNTISSVTHTSLSGSLTVAGFISAATAPVNVYRNHIYTISSNAFGQIMGIAFVAGTSTYTIYNNYIQRLTMPNASGGTSIYGMYFNSAGATYNVYYNTVALGQDAIINNIGVTGIVYPNSASGTFNLRNNIVYVQASPSGTGVASCIRRFGGTAYTIASNFATTSDNNFYWINYGSYNYIYTEGTTSSSIVNGWAWSGATTDGTRNLNNDPCFNIEGSDNSSYKYFMTSDGSSREANSYYDAIPFAGGSSLPYNLKLTTGSTNYAESHAGIIGTITSDWEGDARSGSAPDIGADEGTFVLQAPSCDLLPVELTEFTGWRNEDFKVNELLWKTATEINSDIFEIERSFDGIHFEKIGEVDAAGNSTVEHTYHFTDDAPLFGNNYYRLKMIDFDASYEYSNIIVIYLALTQFANFDIYPVPAQDQLFVSCNIEQDSEVTVMITDILGQVVYNMPATLAEGHTLLKIDTKTFAQGTYILMLGGNGRQLYISKFVKQN